MPAFTKVALLGFCAVALVVVTLKLIFPLLLLYIGGLGVENPLPKRLTMEYPRLAIYLFVVGGPLLFIALVVICIWLMRLPRSV
jgi:hypothetical protein